MCESWVKVVEVIQVIGKYLLGGCHLQISFLYLQRFCRIYTSPRRGRSEDDLRAGSDLSLSDGDQESCAGLHVLRRKFSRVRIGDRWKCPCAGIGVFFSHSHWVMGTMSGLSCHRCHHLPLQSGRSQVRSLITSIGGIPGEISVLGQQQEKSPLVPQEFAYLPTCAHKGPPCQERPFVKETQPPPPMIGEAHSSATPTTDTHPHRPIG